MLFIKASMSSFLASEILTIGRPTLGGLKGWDDPGRHFFGIFWGCLTYIYPIELKNPLGSTWGGHEHVLFIKSCMSSFLASETPKHEFFVPKRY